MQQALVVDTNAKLARLMARLLQERTIAVDTESNSLFAHRERLCLVQISSRHGDWLVDPLAQGLDIGLLAPLFADTAITKVFHDAEFDVLTLKRAWPFEFAGVFDTKVVAASLGLATVGLAPLLRELLQVDLDKRFQRSDWGRRPLTPEQLEYARLDTHYLLELAAVLKERLHAAGMPHALEVAAECRRLEALVPQARPFRADDFVRVRGVEQLSPVGRRIMRELFVMRDRLAAQRDRPAFKILGNDMLLALAAASPTTRAELHRVAAVPEKLRERYGDTILATVAKALEMRPIARLPRASRDGDGSELLTPQQRTVYDNLRAWRKKVASARGTDPALVLARPRMMELALLKQRPKDVAALVDTGLVEPWRAQLYGEAILAAFEQGGRRRRAADEARARGLVMDESTPRMRENEKEPADGAGLGEGREEAHDGDRGGRAHRSGVGENGEPPRRRGGDAGAPRSSGVGPQAVGTSPPPPPSTRPAVPAAESANPAGEEVPRVEGSERHRRRPRRQRRRARGGPGAGGRGSP